VLFLAVLGPSVAVAQHCQGCADDSTTHHMHLLPALGVHVGTPQKASAALGIVVGEDWYRGGRDHSRNIAAFVEPGLSAGRASLAYVSHGFGGFGSGFAIGPSVMRTWKDPWTVQDNATFVGADLAVWPIIFTGPRVGLYRRVSGLEPRRWFLSLDFGIGL
jgi:hypothetical protein